MEKRIKRRDLYDLVCKTIFVGESAVGKTNLILRFAEDTHKSNHINTIGLDFKMKIIQTKKINIKLQLWDTAGDERYRSLTGTYFKGAEAIFFVYAINERKSFTKIEEWK